MELYDAITEHKDFHHVKHALELVEKCISDFGPGNCAMSFNGGKDCIVVFHLLRAAMAHHASIQEAPSLSISSPSSPIQSAPPSSTSLSTCTFFYLRIYDEFPEVVEFMKQTEAKYKFTYDTIQGPSYKEALFKLVDKYPTVKCVFMGQRKGDPGVKGIGQIALTDPGWPQFYRVNPLLNWSYSEIWDFLREFELPYCDLYNRGFSSLGSPSRTKPNPKLTKLVDGQVTYLPAYALIDQSSERGTRSDPVPPQSHTVSPPLSSTPTSQPPSPSPVTITNSSSSL